MLLLWWRRYADITSLTRFKRLFMLRTLTMQLIYVVYKCTVCNSFSLSMIYVYSLYNIHKHCSHVNTSSNGDGINNSINKVFILIFIIIISIISCILFESLLLSYSQPPSLYGKTNMRVVSILVQHRRLPGGGLRLASYSSFHFGHG